MYLQNLSVWYKNSSRHFGKLPAPQSWSGNNSIQYLQGSIAKITKTPKMTVEKHSGPSFASVISVLSIVFYCTGFFQVQLELKDQNRRIRVLESVASSKLPPNDQKRKFIKHAAGKLAISDFWFLISDFWFLISDFWFLISDFWFLISDFWFLISDFWFLISDFWFLISDFWFLISDFWFLISDFWFLISDFWFLISDFWFPFWECRISEFCSRKIGFLIFHN